MANVLIVAYLLIVVALIGVILLQRSEGGGLGMGSSSNGLMSVRGSANLLTRTTAILAALFFATAIGLTILSELDNRTSGILAGAADDANSTLGQPTSVLDALNALEGDELPTSLGDDALNVPAVPGSDATPEAITDTPAAPGSDPALAVPSAPAEGAAIPAPTDGAGGTATDQTTPAAPTN